MPKTVVIIGTLDTKGEEFKYLKDLIEDQGLNTILIDCGVQGNPPFQPDFKSDEVARAGGTTLKDLREERDECKAIAAMAEGAIKIVQELYSAGRVDGIVSLGGSMGTTLGTMVMNTLPLEIPNLMVTTMAFNPILTPEVGGHVTIMPTMADLWGLNRLTRQVIRNAASAICGMVRKYQIEQVQDKAAVGITTLGSAVNQFVNWAKPILEEKGYEVLVFHTVGLGGNALEELIRRGMVKGVLDFSLHELICEYCGIPGASSKRLESAGEMGIPQVISVANIDFFSWPFPSNTLPSRYRDRKMHWHNPFVSVVRTDAEEMVAVAEVIAQKLKKAKGPTVILIPTKGFSGWDAPGEVFYDPDADKAFIEALERDTAVSQKIVRLDLHINAPEFSLEAVQILDAMMKKS